VRVTNAAVNLELVLFFQIFEHLDFVSSGFSC